MSNATPSSLQQGSLLSIKRWLIPLLVHPKVAHALKYTVYTALVLNTFVYIVDDYLAFRSALPPDAPLLEQLVMFATTIDAIAWVGLVFLFELETYALPDEAWTRWVTHFVRVTRVLCYVLIFFAAYGYTDEALENYTYTQVAGISDACDLADDETPLLVDVIKYVPITRDNCESLSDDSNFYQVEGEVAVIAESTLPHVQFMGIIDIVNAFVWLIVVFLIEVEVRMQSADRFSGTLLSITRQTKTLFYLVLIGNGVIWAFDSYYLYAWDAFLWIFGFWAIELNLAEWELERVEELRSEGRT